MASPRKWIIVVLGIIAVSGVVMLICTADTHHTNISYILWKHGWGLFKEKYCSYVWVDDGFKASLVGKPKDEIKRLFPYLHAPDENSYKERLAGRDFYWADTHCILGFEFNNGVIDSLHPGKEYGT